MELEEILALPNRKLLRAYSATEAFELLETESVDLIVIDMVMPKMGGFELLEKLSKDERHANIYAIIILRQDGHLNEHIVHGLDTGAVDYLIKPLKPRVTKAKVAVFEKLYYKQLKLQEQTNRVEELLLNILPARTAKELRISGHSAPRSYDMATVMFTDFKDFTKRATQLTPEELVNELDWHFRNFDCIIEKYTIEKIKTIGDAYMCAGGLPIRNRSNPIDVVLAGLEICNFINDIKEIKQQRNERFWDIRIGIHSGPLVAGVVGKTKWAYDIWGNTVNTANRLESAATPGFVNISEFTYQKVKRFFICEHRGKVAAKHLGEIDMYNVVGIKANYSENGEGKIANAHFRSIISLL